MDYSQALQYLLGFADFERSGRFAARPDIAPLRALLDLLGRPDEGPVTIHLAGSKGKGSTAAMAASILQASGRRTGLFTSPHLHSFRERIQVDGRPLTEATFARHVDALAPAVEEVRRRFPSRELVTFDLLTAMGFLAFQEAGVQAQVIETGLGGRLDSTNALRQKEVCVITPIGREHTAVLGNTIAEIAREKAGVIAPGSTVVMAQQPEEAAGIVRRTSQERRAALREVEKECRWERRRQSPAGQEFLLETPSDRYDLALPLLGRHQMENAAAAVLAVESLAGHGVTTTAAAVREGLANVVWPARLEVLQERPLLVVDAAHSEDSARRLREALAEDLKVTAAVFVVGTSADKDAAAIARELAPLAGRVLATSAAHPRAAPATVVAEAFAAQGVTATLSEDTARAVEGALASVGEDGAVCVTGSLFVAAEARAHVLGIEGDPPVEWSLRRP